MTPNATLDCTPHTDKPQYESLVFSVPECAKILQISTSLAYRLCRTGQIPGVLRLGKRLVVSRVQFSRWLEGGGQEATGD